MCSRAASFPIRRNRIATTGLSSAGRAMKLANNGTLASSAFSSECDPIRPSIVPSSTKRPTPLKFGVGRDSTAANRNNFSSKSSTPNRRFFSTTNPDAIRICGWAIWSPASNFSSKCRRSINGEGPPSSPWRRTPSKSPTNKQVSHNRTRKSFGRYANYLLPPLLIQATLAFTLIFSCLPPHVISVDFLGLEFDISTWPSSQNESTWLFDLVVSWDRVGLIPLRILLLPLGWDGRDERRNAADLVRQFRHP